MAVCRRRVGDGDSARARVCDGVRRCEGEFWWCCRKFVVSRVRDGGMYARS
jgi:hypothetical protein